MTAIVQRETEVKTAAELCVLIKELARQRVAFTVEPRVLLSAKNPPQHYWVVTRTELA